MSKQEINYLPLSKVWAFAADNPSRLVESWQDHFATQNKKGETGSDESKLILSLARGFKVSEGLILVTKMTKAEQLQAQQEIKELWEQLQNLKEDFTTTMMDADGNNRKLVIPPAAIREQFKAIYLPNGKPIRPTHRVVDGHRRVLSLILHVNAVREKLDFEPITEIPCEIKVFSGRGELITASIMANTWKGTGTRKLRKADYAKVSCDLHELGYTESQMQRILKVSRNEAQRCKAFARLDAEHPSLKLPQMVLNGEISWSTLDKEVLRKLSGSTIEEVRSYVTNPSPTNRPSPALSASKLKDVVEGTKNTFGREVLEHVMANDKEALAQFLVNSKSLNDAWTAVKAGEVLAPAVLDEEGDVVTQSVFDALVAEVKVLREAVAASQEQTTKKKRRRRA